MALQQKSTQDWQAFYTEGRLGLQRRVEGVVHKLFLNSFQRVLYHEVAQRVATLLKNQDSVTLLSAGSGIDYIAYKLKKRFGASVRIALLDVSAQCIAENKALFGNSLSYFVGDIFSFDFTSVFDAPVDIIYNTGLLEHFAEVEQKNIITRITKALSLDGFYVTLNPHTAGRVYIHCMRLAQRKKVWPFGREEPILTLRPFATKSFSLVSEYPCCSLGQLAFLLYKNKLLFVVLLPVILFGRYVLVFDRFFGKLFGFYGLVSVFRKG